MAMRPQAGVREDMDVYSADGTKVGTVRRVHQGALRQPVGFDYPAETATQVTIGTTTGQPVDLDVTGAAAPLAGSQPTQAELGVVPGEASAYSSGTGREKAEDIGTADVGTDYKLLGEVSGQQLAPEEANADERDAEGYFQVATGLDATDLYVPLSAVGSAAGKRLTLKLDYEALNRSGWDADPHPEV